MLGKLCKLLRICGIDTNYSKGGMVILLEAKKDQRIVLTKNTRLRGREGVFFIEAALPVMQLKVIIDAYNLHHILEPFSRCILCNEKLATVDKESVKERVPYFTYKNFNEFAICPNCHRIYWKGSHYNKMMEEIEETSG